MVSGQPTKVSHGQRREKLKALLKEKDIPLLVVQNPENRRYLSGFTGSNGWLVVSDAVDALVTDGRYWTQMEEQCGDLQLVKFIQDQHAWIGLATLHWLKERGVSGRVGFEAQTMNVADHEKLVKEARELGLQVELVAADNLTEQLRQCKDDSELEAMRKAARAADRAFRAALEIFKSGITERDFCVELEHQMARQGARKPSFDSIVASGPNGAFPHAGVTDRVINQGELVTVDFGALLDGYCSDTTRTIWVGEPNELSRKVYSTVREAQKRALDAIRPGKIAKEIDKVARDVIAEAGFGEAFKHGLGHGVGLAVHELPGVRSVSEAVLQVGMVVTVEPGIYLPGQTGCRVEDSVVITADGIEFLTRSSYQELGSHHPLDSVTR